MRTRHRLLSLCAAAALASCYVPPASPPPPPPAAAATPAPAPGAPRFPPTEARPVTDEYHGVKVVDPYRWLEAAGDPAVKSWIDVQNKAARAYLEAVPFRKIIHDRVQKIITSVSENHFALRQVGDRLFALKFKPPKQQPFLVALSSPTDLGGARVVLDPAALDPTGRTAIDWYVPSPDGKKVAVSLSQGGTENGTVHVFDADTGKDTGERVTYAHSGTAGGSLAWAADGKGFYYTRHPHPGERPAEDMGFFQQVYFHKLGNKEADDTYELGKDLPRIAEIELSVSEDGKLVLASVQNGDGGEYWHYLRDTKGAWSRFADLPDKIVGAKLGVDGKLYLLSVKDAPRGKILRLDPKRPDLAKAEVLVPGSEVTIQSFLPLKSRLFVADLDGGPSQIRVFDLAGKDKGKVPLPPITGVRQMVRQGAEDLLFSATRYTAPPAWHLYRGKDGSVTKTPMAMTSAVSFEDIEVTREMCASKDGTKVPVNILRKKGAPRDGSGPALLTGYGGYGVSLLPGQPLFARFLLDQGGAFAVANLRGGGEYGEAWHRGGNLTKKQNVFDDFYACAKHLVDSGVTKPSRLAILGGSNGGLLMGAAMTQHPEMYKAVISVVGIYDMLRVELTTNGAFNVTEFGTVKNPDHFKAMYAYSPLHNVKDGVAYPPVLLLTGANDPRVDPYHSRKMTARLQAATTGGQVLLRASGNTGHGQGTPLDDQIEEITDIYTFLHKELGLEPKP